jgi:hypothetical protein
VRAAAAGVITDLARGADATTTRPADLASAAPPSPTPREASTAEPAAAAPALPLPDVTADGAVLRNAAHLRISAPGVGDLELHLRVRDGVAHVRVDGDAGRALESRAAELSRALAGEGLKLGALDAKPAPAAAASFADAGSSSSRDHGSSGRHRDDPSAPPPPTSPPAPRRAPGATSPATSGRYAVRA